jgi:hypothetical protein
VGEIDFDVTDTLLPYYGGDEVVVTLLYEFSRGGPKGSPSGLSGCCILHGDDLVTDMPAPAISRGPCDWP